MPKAGEALIDTPTSARAGGFRTEQGGVLIDRSKPVAFFMNGVSYLGFEGDTLASGLLAQGAAQASRSALFGRPRALVSAAGDEPHALYRIEDRRGAQEARPATLTPLRPGLKAFAPGAPATLSGGLRRLLAPLLDTLEAGRPTPRAALDERRAAGYAEEELNVFTDVLVIGGGIAGIAAAKAAAASGARVLLVEREAHWGGRALAGGGKIGRLGAGAWIDQEIDRLQDAENATLRLSTEAIALDEADGPLLLERPETGPLRRLWRVRAGRVVLATGAAERGLVFAQNDLPGVMGADSMRQYLALYGVAAGRNIVVFTTSDEGYRTALALAEAGVEIAAIIDPRSQNSGGFDLSASASGSAPRQAAEMGLPIRRGSVAVRGVADDGPLGRIAAVEIAKRRGSGRFGAREFIACDALGVFGGWCPETRLFAEAGGLRVWDDAGSFARPDPSAPILALPCEAALSVVGAANGALQMQEALQQGVSAGRAAAKAVGYSAARMSVPKTSGLGSEAAAAPSDLVIVPGLGVDDDGDRHFLDSGSDLTLEEVERAGRGGAATVDDVLAATGVKAPLSAAAETLVAVVVADMRGVSIGDALGRFAAPTRVGVERAPLFDAPRETPMQPWHETHGAVFADQGGWRAPRAFLRQSGPSGEMEDDTEAAIRETRLARLARLARRGVAAFDASSLAKFLITGAEAPTVLNALLSKSVSDLKTGRCQVSVASDAEGAALGEALTARLRPSAFLAYGPPESEEALRKRLSAACENAEARFLDVTDAYAQIAVTGPKARLLLERLTECDLSEASLPALSFTEVRLAGLDARVFRVCQGGGLGFELAVPSAYGVALWEALFAAGELLGLQPMGAAARDILRIERGRPAPGREADGVAEAVDLDPSAGGAPGRRGLVGLEPEDPDLPLPEGAPLYRGEGPRPAGFFGLGAAPPLLQSIGRVTSSCWSPNVERAIALALIEQGARRIGETVHLRDEEGRLMRARVVSPSFVDPHAQNIDGWRSH